MPPISYLRGSGESHSSAPKRYLKLEIFLCFILYQYFVSFCSLTLGTSCVRRLEMYDLSIGVSPSMLCCRLHAIDKFNRIPLIIYSLFLKVKTKKYNINFF